MGKTHDLGVADPWGCSRLSWAWCAKKWGLLQTLWCIENMQSSTRCIYGSSSCSSTAGFLERWQETVESGEAIWFDTCSILQHIFNYIYICVYMCQYVLYIYCACMECRPQVLCHKDQHPVMWSKEDFEGTMWSQVAARGWRSSNTSTPASESFSRHSHRVWAHRASGQPLHGWWDSGTI